MLVLAHAEPLWRDVRVMGTVSKKVRLQVCYGRFGRGACLFDVVVSRVCGPQYFDSLVAVLLASEYAVYIDGALHDALFPRNPL